MTLLLIAIGVLLGSAVMALFAPSRVALRISAAGAVVTACLGGVPAITAVVASGGEEWVWSWGMFGHLRLGLDPLTGFFLLPVLLLGALGSIYGIEYLATPAGTPRRASVAAATFNVLVASMALVVMARDALGFLVAWELMALSSFFLVVYDHEQEGARQAGWIYLVASHLGTAFIFGFFFLLGGKAGAFDFASLQAAASAEPGLAGLLFVFAIIGFGAKAGFLPLHVWLPEAHPAAPSHVSALMSGVMIKTGIYGIVRALMLLGPPAPWWGWTLITIGVTSGILGVLFALAQHDLKRLLAYHSVENIGIIALGLGLGLLGVAHAMPVLAVLGFAGGLLHVVNHALFKGVLFLGAGSVLHATGTREIDHLGGLAKRMPWTAAAFLTGSVAICGLPPLNGFVSEFLIYLAAFGVFAARSHTAALPALAAVAGLALIGGLAVACFTKAFGTVFSGEARSEHCHTAHDPGPAMRLPMGLLALLCVAIGVTAPLLIPALAPLVASVSGLAIEPVEAELARAQAIFVQFMPGVVILLAVGALLFWARHRLLRGRAPTEGVTWDCGYARPAPSMQYTASSFADPVLRLFQPFLQTRREVHAEGGYFPAAASLTTDTPDLFTTRLLAPLFMAVERMLKGLRWLQHGGIHLYVLYVALTLIILLVVAL